MKGIILYFSLTGNTKLACNYIKAKVTNIDFELHNMRDGYINLSNYDIIGFATYSESFSIAEYVKNYILGMEYLDKPAFVFSTYGKNNGATCEILGEFIRKKGFKIVANHALNTPENMPPVIKLDHGHINNPSEKQLSEFSSFIVELQQLAESFAKKESLNEIKIKFKKGDKIIANVMNKIMFPSVIKTLMGGNKKIDPTACTQCKKCISICPYGIISMKGYPEFDEKRCHGCFACYNLCPSKAIFTNGYNKVGMYPEPNNVLKEKLKIKP